MHNRVVILPLLLLLLMACQKNELGLNLTPHTEQKVVGEGLFTDAYEKHQFRFMLSNNLGSDTATPANEISMLIKTPDGPVAFNRIGNGLFQAAEPFQGVYGTDYTIQFSYKGNVHEVITEMPSPVEVKHYDFVPADSLIYPRLGKINLYIDSPKNQFLKFDLYKADSLLLPEDTVWQEVKLPVYRIAPIVAGDSVMVTLPIENEDSYFIFGNELVKLKTYIISEDVGNYLMKLRSYVTSELLNSQFYNPPYYYSNQAYGLGYGTIVDSTIFRY